MLFFFIEAIKLNDVGMIQLTMQLYLFYESIHHLKLSQFGFRNFLDRYHEAGLNMLGDVHLAELTFSEQLAIEKTIRNSSFRKLLQVNRKDFLRLRCFDFEDSITVLNLTIFLWTLIV